MFLSGNSPFSENGSANFIIIFFKGLSADTISHENVNKNKRNQQSPHKVLFKDYITFCVCSCFAIISEIPILTW